VDGNQRTMDKPWMNETARRKLHTAPTKFFLSQKSFRSAAELKWGQTKKIEILYKQVFGWFRDRKISKSSVLRVAE